MFMYEFVCFHPLIVHSETDSIFGLAMATQHLMLIE